MDYVSKLRQVIADYTIDQAGEADLAVAITHVENELDILTIQLKLATDILANYQKLNPENLRKDLRMIAHELQTDRVCEEVKNGNSQI